MNNAMDTLDTYNSIKRDINSKSPAFNHYLQVILDRESYTSLMRLSQITEVYIFSGIIRDFLIEEIGYVRDIDIVIKSLLTRSCLRHCLRSKTVVRNSFGGLKIRSSKITVDAWYLKNTWGIVTESLAANVNSLIETAFFNFSAIVYDIRAAKFIYNNHFVEFLRTRTMDIVYEKNPNIPLCLFNVFYYHLKYGFNVGAKLRMWIHSHRNYLGDFTKVQRSHLGGVYFSNTDINNYLNSL
jgi:hypothetical protein